MNKLLEVGDTLMITSISGEGHLTGIEYRNKIFVSMPILDQTESMYNYLHYLSEGTTIHSHLYSQLFSFLCQYIKGTQPPIQVIEDKDENDLGIFQYNNIPQFSIYSDDDWICDTNSDVLELDLASKLKYVARRHTLSIISKVNVCLLKGLGRASVTYF